MNGHGREIKLKEEAQRSDPTKITNKMALLSMALKRKKKKRKVFFKISKNISNWKFLKSSNFKNRLLSRFTTKVRHVG